MLTRSAIRRLSDQVAWVAPPADEGLKLDFLKDAATVVDYTTPANDYSGGANSLLTYTAPSTKWIWNALGVLTSGTTLRCNHDPATKDTSSTPLTRRDVNFKVRREITTTGAVTYVAGQHVRITLSTDITKWMLGRVVSYDTGELVVDVYASSGYVSGDDWTIIVALGVLIEERRTNLLLNSASLSTQNVTVTATAHTLSFSGTGTITLSGASTAGPLVGTGANNRVSLTFTPSAGSLTLTVSGTVERAQIEAGAPASSYIPTTSSAVTRNADNISKLLSGLPDISGGWSYYASFRRPPINATIFELQLSSSAGADRNPVYRNSAGAIASLVTTGGASQGGNSRNPSAATDLRVAGRTFTDDLQMALNGDLAPGDTEATLPPVDLLRIGSLMNVQFLLNEHIRELVITPSRWSDAEILARTTS